MKKVVLVGGGHAHVYLIKKYAEEKHFKINLMLVSTYERQYYSGMASAFLEGIYDLDDFSIDLKKLCQEACVEFVEGSVYKIDTTNRKIFCNNLIEIPFDILSLDVGSEVAGKSIKGVNLFAITVKPLINLVSIKEKIDRTINKNLTVLVAGAGAAGVELSLAIKKYSTSIGKELGVFIIGSGENILEEYSFKVRDIIIKMLYDNNIGIYLNEKIVEVMNGHIYTQKNRKIDFDILIWAVGSSANPVCIESGIATDKKGYMLVNNYLQSKENPYIFGAGDCIGFENYQYVRKVGVYAIKEAPILWKNINRYIENKKLKKYTPQKTFLSIISTGGKTAVLIFKGLVLSSRLAWYIKDIIDRGFIGKIKIRTKE